MRNRLDGNGNEGATALGSPPTNGAILEIETTVPYIAEVRLTGVADILLHGWNCESIEEKSKAAKGSATKKTDNLESYVYRNADGFICIPGKYVHGAIVLAAKFEQDPRSPRKSAMDLFKAGIAPLTPLASLGSKTWDFEDKQRVTVNRSGITRTRPAFKAGWEIELDLMVLLPEYISPAFLNKVLSAAGRLVGIADYRPTYGRFLVTSFAVRE